VHEIRTQYNSQNLYGSTITLEVHAYKETKFTSFNVHREIEEYFV